MSKIDLNSLARRLTQHHRWVMRAIQLAIFIVTALLAFILRFDFNVPWQYRPHMLAALLIFVPAKILVFRCFKLDHGWWRYVSVRDVTRLAMVNLAGSAAGCLGLLLFGPVNFPRSIYLLDFMLCLGMTAGVRLAVRLAFEFSKLPNPSIRQRILIYGAGDAGVTLVREIHQNPALPYDVLGFIDDDPGKVGRLIHGVKVVGTGSTLPSVVEGRAIDTVLIALPSATAMEMTAILNRCHDAAIFYKTIPGLAQVIQGVGLAGQIRAVSVEDLLGREPVRLEEDDIRRTIEGRVVLVTGAAGSIGSELCRQIARFHPGGIVGFDIAESPLFEIDFEMRRTFPRIPFFSEIGSIQNRVRLDEVFRRYTPSVVYHAAAYKHVPMMEAHVFEAIENNVFGTYNVATGAAEHGVEDFVMISSDKAVRPVNVMGATKRVAELMLRALQNGRTKFVAVRFGNVLGSNGSVIPIFKKQIAAGGPVTITHRDMRRFFMTTPEACQLVLQAAAIGKGGQICVLNMGEPVKVVDLARNLILLSGLQPDQDIKIEFTGIRPGEKLCEELSSLLEDTAPTTHEKIRTYLGNGLPQGELEMWLSSLREACAARDIGRLVMALKDIEPAYNPSGHILRRVVDSTRKESQRVGVPPPNGAAEKLVSAKKQLVSLAEHTGS